jgi:hypothetical protein
MSKGWAGLTLEASNENLRPERVPTRFDVRAEGEVVPARMFQWR